MDSIKYIDHFGDFKLDKIYYLYNTSSSEINLEILSQFKKFESSPNFFFYYTENDIKNLLKLLNKLDENLTSIFNDNSYKFSTNTDKYISQISKIILIFTLIQKIQEISSKFLLKSKQYLNEISNNYKIENIYQDKLFSLINNLENNFTSDISLSTNNYSKSSTQVNSSSSLNLFSISSSKKQIEISNDEIQNEFFNEKKLSVVDEEILSDVQTPGFIDKISNKDNVNTPSNISHNTDLNDDEFNLSFRNMNFILNSNPNILNNFPIGIKSKQRTEKFHRKNALSFSIDKIKNCRSASTKSEMLNIKPLNEDAEIKMYRDFLLLVKKLYKSCLITADEKIEIKKLIISKSKKIIDFYIKEYENIKNDNLKSANAIKKLL